MNIKEHRITWQIGPELLLPHHGSSEAAPAFAKFGEYLVAVWRGANPSPIFPDVIFPNERLYWSRLSLEGDGTPRWSEIYQVHENALSQERPAVAALGSHLLVVSWNSVEDQKLYFSTLHPDSLSWSDPRAIDGAGSSTGPALAPWEMNGRRRVYALWKGADGDDAVHNAYLAWYDGSWDWPKRLAFVETDANPSLTCRGGEIFVSWKNSRADKIYWMRVDRDGNVLSKEPQELGWFGESNLGPALAEVGGTIYAAWKGKGWSTDVWLASWPGKENRFSPARLVPNSHTNLAPSLVGWDSWLVLAWRGVDGEKSMWWRHGRMG